MIDIINRSIEQTIHFAILRKPMIIRLLALVAAFAFAQPPGAPVALRAHSRRRLDATPGTP